MSAQRILLRMTGTLTALLVPSMAFAQSGFSTSVMQTIGTTVQWIIQVLNLVTWVAFIYLNQLLDPNVIFDDGNLNPILNQIWQLSRNIMNVVFAVLLIGAAIYTVVTAKKDFVAQHLKTFVLAVVLVNFSWFIPRVILDIGTIAATTVYNLPSALGQNNQCTYLTETPPVGQLGDGCVQTNNAVNNGAVPTFECPCVMATNAAFFVNTINDYPQSNGWQCYLGQTMCIQMAQINSTDVAPHSAILNGLILNHARLTGLTTVPPSVAGNTVNQLIMYFLQMGVVLIIHIALFFPLAALMLAFAIRIPVIWLTIAFMPFIILQYLLPQGELTEWPKKIQDLFIKAAFLPAIVGVPLSIGFIMINAGQQVATFGNLQQIKFRLTSNISDLYELLWLILCLGVIWVGVFSILQKMDIMGKGADFIKQQGQNMGSLAGKMALHVPLPGMSISPLKMLGGLNMRNQNASFDQGVAQGKSLKEILEGMNSGSVGRAGTIRDNAENHTKDAAKIPQHLQELNREIEALKNVMAANSTATDAQKQSAMQTVSTRVGFTINEGNYKQDLRTYLSELETAGGTNVTNDASHTPLKQSIDNL